MACGKGCEEEGRCEGMGERGENGARAKAGRAFLSVAALYTGLQNRGRGRGNCQTDAECHGRYMDCSEDGRRHEDAHAHAHVRRKRQVGAAEQPSPGGGAGCASIPTLLPIACLGGRAGRERRGLHALGVDNGHRASRTDTRRPARPPARPPTDRQSKTASSGRDVLKWPRGWPISSGDERHTGHVPVDSATLPDVQTFYTLASSALPGAPSHASLRHLSVPLCCDCAALRRPNGRDFACLSALFASNVQRRLH